MGTNTTILLFLVCVCCSEPVSANGCARLSSDLPRGPVINICEESSITISEVFYMSGSSAEMGIMTRCNCSIVALTQEATQSSLGYAVSQPQFTQCNAIWHIRGSREGTFTCQTTHNFSMNMNASIVTVDVQRQVLDDFDFCLYVVLRDNLLGKSHSVTCSNNADQFSSTVTSGSESPVTLTTASTTSGSSALTSTNALPVTSQGSTSMGSSASVSVSASAVPPTPSSVSGSTVSPPSSSMSGSKVPQAFTSTTGCGDRVEASPCQCSVAVAMAVVGWVVAVGISAALTFVCIRLRNATSTRPPEGGADNSAYAHLSELTRTDPRADHNYCVIGHSVTQQ